jgi:DNA-binding MarR family transcriptional regulator
VTLRALLRTLALLERVMQPYFAQLGISSSQWGVLRTLQQSGPDGLRLVDLSELLLIRPPSVTGVVDRLERAGLVKRLDSPLDARSKQVALTPVGRQLVERVLAGLPEQYEKVLGILQPEEQVTLVQLLDRLGLHFEALLHEGPRPST